MSELKHECGKDVIPASLIRLGYPRPTLRETGAKYVYPSTGRLLVSRRFDALFESPPIEVKVQEIPERHLEQFTSAPWRGAVQPVWLTMRIPADAAPGLYQGKLIVHSAGAPIDVPVSLEVHDYQLPDPRNFQTSVGFLEFPEGLADYYKVPLWSDKHWALITKSLAALARIGNQVLFVPLICRTHLRNRETMVRWVKGQNGYRYDFSLLERYLDTALKVGNRPRVVCLQVWDYHVGSAGRRYKLGTGRYGQSEVFQQQPVPVSVLDPESGTVTEMEGPRYTDPVAEAFWKPVAEEVQRVLTKRGLQEAVMLGTCGDYVPVKETVVLWNKLLPGAPWVTMAHGSQATIYAQPVGYATSVFGAHSVDPARERKYGWQRPDMTAYFPRYADNQAVMGLAYERTFFEFGLLCGLRGAGRQTLDDFADYRTRRHGAPNCSWGSLTHGPAWLAPGTDGPISTERFQMGLEGIQECEARIFIEKALTDEVRKAKLGKELAQRCQAILDERTRCVAWGNEQNTNQMLHCYLPSGPLGSDWYAGGSQWQERSRKLYAAAAEVARALE